jgi:NitT/TauT family transport system permease protein
MNHHASLQPISKLNAAKDVIMEAPMNQLPPLLPGHVQQRALNSVIYLAVFALLMVGVAAVYRGGIEIAELEVTTMTVTKLPAALLLSFGRMAGSYVASLVFALVLGLLASRSRFGERLILPMLDVLQSVPVVGFFPAAVGFFISIADGSRIGVELAATFLIFTSMAWNMAFAVYEAIKGLPEDQIEAMDSFGISGIRKLTHLYFPATVPRLVYNSILSWSNGWYFLVACEIIAVGPLSYNLPGIGSFLKLAAEQDQLDLILAGLGSLSVLVLLMDYFVWRPASQWSRKFLALPVDPDEDEEEVFLAIPRTWISYFSPLATAAKVMVQVVSRPFQWLAEEVLLPLFWELPVGIISGLLQRLYFWVTPVFRSLNRRLDRLSPRTIAWVSWVPLIALSLGLLFQLTRYIGWPPPDIIRQIPWALMASTLRLLAALALCLVLVLPLTFVIWKKPKLRQTLTSIAQVGASIPAIALFPLFILVAVQNLGGGMEAASILLLVTGMVWYILFNALGGLSTIDEDMIDLARSFGLSGTRTFIRLVLPAMKPALITGTITAWGGGWNALVVAEYINFKGETLSVNGIGALISKTIVDAGDERAMVLCLAVMVAWIILINALVWQRMYREALESNFDEEED